MSSDIRLSHPRKWTILALVLAAEIMDLLDSTIVNVAAPTIHDDLHAGSAALQWIIGGYALAFAVGLIAGGRLGDIYGRRRLFVIGSLGFVAASMACAFAQTPEMLIGFRLAQGASAALLIPQGLGIVRNAFVGADLQKAFTVFGPVIGLSAVLGPIIGGALIAANAFGSGWRLIFFVNLPLGLIAAIGAARLMPESRSPKPPTLDVAGTLLAALGMGLLIYPLIQGREAGWPTWTYVMIAGSAVSFVALGLWGRLERRRGRDPLIEASIFKHRSYSAGLGTIIVFFGGMIGTLLVLTLFLQLGEHFSAIHAGVTLAPFAVGTAIGATLAGALLVPKFGRTVLQVACVIMAARGVLAAPHRAGPRARHQHDDVDRPAVGGRNRDGNDGGAAVRLHPRFGDRHRGRLRVGCAQRGPAARRRDRRGRDRDAVLLDAGPRRVRHRAQPLAAGRAGDDAGAAGVDQPASPACP